MGGATAQPRAGVCMMTGGSAKASGLDDGPPACDRAIVKGTALGDATQALTTYGHQ